MSDRGVGLSRFLSRVYLCSGLGVAGTLASAYFLMPVTRVQPGLALSVGFMGSLLSLSGIAFNKPKYKAIQGNYEVVYYAKDSPIRQLSFLGLTASMGLTLSPYLALVLKRNPNALISSLLMSTWVFGGCALASRGLNMKSWHAPLTVGLSSMCSIGIVSSLLLMLHGPNPFTTTLHTIDTYAGIALFMGFLLYDGYIAHKMYRQHQPDHLGCATSLYLDFMNIFVRFIDITSEKKKKKREEDEFSA